MLKTLRNLNLLLPPFWRGEKFKPMPWSELRHSTDTRICQIICLILTSFTIKWMHVRVILPFFYLYSNSRARN